MDNTTRFMNSAVVKNRLQGSSKRVLCVCTAGVLRSPTAAEVLSRPPYNFNTRSAGANQDVALIPVTQQLLDWADELVFMTQGHLNETLQRGFDIHGKEVQVLNIRDDYAFRDPELVKAIQENYFFEV